jgi:SRSO17 transposase
MKWNERLWKQSLRQYQQFMAPLVSVLGRSERRVSATRYVEGLLTPGERKSIEPLAARLGVDKQSLQQFVTDSPWSDKTVWSSVRREVIPHLEPIEAWIVDETGWLKQGSHSVGVSHQYCGAVGKQANCQVSVEVAVSDGWVAAPIAGQLYLPSSWSEDSERCAAAGVPEAIEFWTKPQLAERLIEEALSDGIAPAPVLGDAVYGDNAEFRAQLRRLGMEFFLQVDASKHKGWDHQVQTEIKRVRRHVQTGQPVESSRLETLQLGGCRWANSQDTAGLGRGFLATGFATTGRPTGGTLAGGGLARRGFGTLSLLSGSPSPPAHQGPLLEVEPVPLACGAILSALQDRPGSGSL